MLHSAPLASHSLSLSQAYASQAGKHEAATPVQPDLVILLEKQEMSLLM